MCPGGPFCDLETGEYLNTIYRGDFKRLHQFEETALKGSNDAIKKLMFNDEKMYDLLTKICGGANLTLLPYTINEYMYAYQKNASNCFKQGFVSLEYRDRTRDIVNKDVCWDGTEVETYRSEGYERYAKYVINKEFMPTCNDLCMVRDSKMIQPYFDAWLNKENALFKKNGIRKWVL